MNMNMRINLYIVREYVLYMCLYIYMNINMNMKRNMNMNMNTYKICDIFIYAYMLVYEHAH